MKSTKTRLTNLIKSVDSLPNGEELFGFPGIDKNIIKSTLEEDYTLLDLINKF